MAEYYASTWKGTYSGNTRYYCGYIYYNWYPEYSATTSLFEITGLGIRQTSSGKANWSGGTASASASCDGQPTLSASRALSGNEWNWNGAGNKSLWSGSWGFWYGRTTYAYYPYVTVAGAKTGGSAWSGSASSAFQIGIPALPAYTVSYNANGGTGAPAAQTKWYGINLALSSTAPTRTGYTFAGWSTTQGGSVVYQPGATYSANGGATLWAVWTANTWTISYDANGGTGSIADQTKTYDQTLTLSDGTGISRTNHSLIEWNTMPSGSGDVYAKGEVLNETFAQSLSLYAQWHLDYIAPVITNFNAYRVDSASSSTETDDGEYIYVTFDYRAGTADSGTTWETPHCKIIIDGDASHPVFDSDLIISSGEGTFPSSTIAFGTYSKDTTHSVQISLFDSYNVISGAYTEIATATYPIDLYGNGTDVYMGVMTPHVIGQMLTLPEETYIDGTKLWPGGGVSVLDFYPVGSYYETSDTAFNPNVTWGGTWSLEAEGLVHIGAGSNYTVGDTGGEETHTLTVDEMPSHNHLMGDFATGLVPNGAYNGAWLQAGSKSTQNTGGGQAHNNMQPYIVVNRWHRTA